MLRTRKNLVLALAAVFVFGAIGLYAQTGVVANVPFGFTVQSVTMPAGEYRLIPVYASQGVIEIRNLQTRVAVLVFAPSSLSTHKGEETESGKVIFHRYGDQYFFSEVWTPNGLRGRAMPSKLEQEVKARSAESQMASINISLAESK